MRASINRGLVPVIAIVTSILVLALAFRGTISAVPAATSKAVKTASTETYADYSMMFSGTHGYAGQLWMNSPGSTGAVSQWAWHHTSPTTSDINWGSPANWPQGANGPGVLEHFVVNGPWVELTGWSGTVNGQTSNGHDYTQTVTSQSVGLGDCSAMIPIPVNNDHELYALYNIPDYSYCVEASGVITNNYNSTVVNFKHWQKWSKVPCNNQYHSGDTCIQQDEKWWDDNGHPYQLMIDRSGWLAKGKGWYKSTNRVMNGTPNTTTISGRYFWAW